MGPGGQLSGETPGLLVGDVIGGDARAARRLPGEGDAVGVEGGEADVGGWDDHRFGWERKETSRGMFQPVGEKRISRL